MAETRLEMAKVAILVISQFLKYANSNQKHLSHNLPLPVLMIQTVNETAKGPFKNDVTGLGGRGV